MPDEDLLVPGSSKDSFSPKLRQAMQEILAVCRKHDIGGYIVLASEKHVEERTRFPTWSVAQVEPENGRIRVRFRTKGKPKENVPHTLNLLHSFSVQPGLMALNMGDMIKMLKTHMEFTTTQWEGPEAPPWDYK